MKPVKNAIKYFLKKINFYRPYFLRQTGPLKEDGWFRSFRDEAVVDGEGNPLPWITYPAIDFVKKRLRSDMTVFEYGCGWSTLWWASRVKAIVSVEHDKEWHDKMKRLAPRNSRIFHIDLEQGGAYSKKVAEFHAAFDIIVIDGRDRINCAKNAVKALKPDGVIIWDNSDRAAYEPGFRFLFQHGFRKIEFIGLAPLINYKSETCIFYRSTNCLNI
jgi:hypothetical protein